MKTGGTIPLTRVACELPGAERSRVRTAALRSSDYGVHWVWKNGAEYLTADGLRLIADAYDAANDKAAALVCRRLVNEAEAAPTPPPRAVVAAVRDRIAERWDLRAEMEDDDE